MIKLELNTEEAKAMLVRKAEVLNDFTSPHAFNRVQLTFADSVKSHGIIMDPDLLLEACLSS